MIRSPDLTTTQLAEIIGIDQTTATRTLAHIKKAGLARLFPTINMYMHAVQFEKSGEDHEHTAID